MMYPILLSFCQMALRMNWSEHRRLLKIYIVPWSEKCRPYDKAKGKRKELIIEHMNNINQSFAFIHQATMLRAGIYCDIGEHGSMARVLEEYSYFIDNDVAKNALLLSQYCFEPSDMELSSKKRIKLYDFKVLEKSSGIIKPGASLDETNRSRGLDKIEKVLKEEFRHSLHDCIVLLNGIDITEYFSETIAVALRHLKKEEHGSAHFRYIHRGLNERIQHLKQSNEFISFVLKDEPQKIETALADIDKQIYELQEQVK